MAGGGSYVIWMERETRGTIENINTALIYTAYPFLTPVNVTERRNLVYNFRSLLSCDTKGRLIAGLYFKIRDEGPLMLTAFWQQNGSTKKVQLPLLQPVSLEVCGQQLGMKPGQLEDLLENLGQALGDISFRKQLIEINNNIANQLLAI